MAEEPHLRLPLAHAFVVTDWPGIRSLLREGWTGILGDRVCVYHRSREGETPWVECATYVDGEWLDSGVTARMLTDRVGRPEKLIALDGVLEVDGISRRFAMHTCRNGWSARSLDLHPVVTVVASGIGPSAVTLKAERVEAIHGYDTFHAV